MPAAVQCVFLKIFGSLLKRKMVTKACIVTNACRSAVCEWFSIRKTCIRDRDRVMADDTVIVY